MTNATFEIARNTEVGGYILYRKGDCAGKWYPTEKKAKAALAKKIAKRDWNEIKKNADTSRFLEKHKEFLSRFNRG